MELKNIPFVFMRRHENIVLLKIGIYFSDPKFHILSPDKLYPKCLSQGIINAA